MRSKSLFPIAFVTLLAAAPAMAGDLGLYGSYWDTDALGETAGGGAKFVIGDAAVRWELRGSFFPDLTEDFDQLVDDGSGEIEVEAIVPEAGIAYNFAPGNTTQFYLGAGLSYYLLDATDVELDDEVGYYGVAGLSFGGRGDGPALFAELMYRSVEGTVEDEDLVRDIDVDLSGPAANVGVLFRF